MKNTLCLAAAAGLLFLLGCGEDVKAPAITYPDIEVGRLPEVSTDAREWSDVPGDGTSIGCNEPEECTVENEFGACHGLMPCENGVLGKCQAQLPTAETCNGLDDDCDGEVDNFGDGVSGCDDGNPCTQDACEGEAGCAILPLDGVECDDGNACTEAGLCVAGACQAPALECDDGEVCTTDSCDPDVGCVFDMNAGPCDDEDPCTVGDQCSEGGCAGFAVPCDCQADEECLPLEDGDLCNGTLFCDLASFPQECAVIQDSIIACPEPGGPGSECLAPLCDPDTGECGTAPTNEGGACSDDDPCTVGETCVNGACGAGVAANCNDGNPCTNDICATGVGCQHLDNQDPCEDGSACTVGDHCLGGQCAPGAALTCDDGNDCTLDSCEAEAGCVHQALQGACDDGNPCTAGDQCVEGLCLPTGPADCSDANPCTTDTCNPLTGCHYVDNALPCNDGNACTVAESCAGGKCLGGEALNCNDGNNCTTDSCEPEAGCLHADNDDPCEDGSICTVGDACEAGVCAPGKPVKCDDGNPCTADSCDPVGGCVHQAQDGACDDKNTCTTNDHCASGACVGEGSLDCDDGNSCTTDICLPQGGCQHEAAQGACSDGDSCTSNDTCQGGLCVAGPPLACDDTNPCTEDSCKGGLCVNLAAAGDCDDGNACTEADTCLDGVCVGGLVADCDDANVCTTDYCAPATGCQHSNNSVPCSDASVCTLNDVCANGSCQAGGVLECGDANPCTDDSCDPVAGCLHAYNSDECDDDNPCTTGDLCANGQCKGTQAVDCDDGNPCTDDMCHPFDGCMHLANSDPCDDQDECTTVDSCVDSACVGGVPANCDDGNGCTDDTCLPESGCEHENNELDCDDLDACTTADKCQGGLCLGGPPLTCEDESDCTVDTCVPESGCVFSSIVPCCGNDLVDDGEECDHGASNGQIGLDSCTSDCTWFGDFELVASMSSGGKLLAGSWDAAYVAVVDEMRDCVVRFDNRLFRPRHVEYSSGSLRFDFQELNAWHNSWDGYAFVQMENGTKAGLGATYRRGHDNEVWKKDTQQYATQYWQAMQVDLYCERETDYAHAATVDGAGTFTFGNWDELYTQVADNAATCKVRFDGRLATVSHIEHAANRVYFDLLGLQAHYDGWDSYAYIDVVPGTRAGIGAAYRRGHESYIWRKDRAQHGESEWHPMTVTLFCKDVFTEEFQISPVGAVQTGDWETLHKYVVEEGRDCKVMYDDRVSEPKYIEYTNDTLRFDMMNLHAYHDSWDSFVSVMVGDGKASGTWANYRRGNASDVWKKTAVAHVDKAYKGVFVRIRCEGEASHQKVYEISAAGKDKLNDWNAFFGQFSGDIRAFECKVRWDGRVTMPVLVEHGNSGGNYLYFDFLGLSAFHDGWDAYATLLAKGGLAAGFGASYRRSHHTVVWKRDRDQNSLFDFHNATLEFLCK